MGVPLSPKAQAFIKEKVFGNVATVMRNGSPQVTTVWVDTDGTNVLVNSVEGRVKVKNMQRDSRVALAIVAEGNAYRALFVRGRVTSMTTDGAADHYEALAKKYERPVMGQPGHTRIKIFIEPLSVIERGL